MNETYIPIGQAPFRAARWVSDDADKVASFLKLLIDHDLRFKFETVYEEYDITIDVFRGPTRIEEVDDGHWLAVLPDQTVKKYTDREFIANFKENKK